MTEWVDDDELTITYRTMKQMISEAQEGECERIIALLEEEALVNEADGKFFTGLQGEYSRTSGEALRLAIALIKGENK